MNSVKKSLRTSGNEGLTKTQGVYSRDEVYDWLRLIATVFVVIGHSAYLSINSIYGGVAYELPEQVHPLFCSRVFLWLRWLPEWVYGFHMQLFFMLSGAVLGLKPIPPFDTFFKSKVKRLLFPYFVWGWCFMIPVKRLGNFYDNQSVFQAMNGLLNGVESGHLWFLTALFWCLIVFCILYKCLHKFGITSGYIILLFAGVIQLTGGTYLPFDVLGLKTGLSYIFYFALGYQFQYERSIHKRWNIRKTVFALIIVFCIEYLNYHFRIDILDPFFIIIAGAFFSFLLSDLCSRVFAGIGHNKLWQIIIRDLFYVYIFHDPLEYIMLRITMHYGLLFSAGGCIAYVIMRTVLVFALGIGLGELVRLGKKSVGIFLADA